ncbi:hypothetical protein HPP92_017104 [Vanilla planifolia]|uniref:CW-type domain-containing protein n=1 Tax=Vanilla planifolia TaxID=51239 RepID=A0A835QDF8_VANPL|nr:hypothetical protein HPP92_017104 [Vanilla planifolia]
MNKESSSSSITSKSTPNKSPGDAEFGVENSAEQCSMTCSNSVVINNVGCNSPREDLIPESNQIENSLAPPLNFVASNVSSRTMPSIGAFAVQCALCFKWRLIPTKENTSKYIGSILQIPFVCEVAHEWHADLSCDDPEDISQDGSRVWAIDKRTLLNHHLVGAGNLESEVKGVQNLQMCIMLLHLERDCALWLRSKSIWKNMLSLPHKGLPYHNFLFRPQDLSSKIM